jgi:hypothetical protein
MIIAPLVFSTLVVGIAHMGDSAALGRVGAKAVGWFLAASIISLSLGLLLVTIFQPGVGLGLPLPPVDATVGVDRSAFRFRQVHRPHLPGIDDRRDGGERYPPDRRLLAVRRASRSWRSASRPSRWSGRPRRWSR